MRRIYISGPISGRSLNEARCHFAQAEEMLRKKGFRTINPMRMRLCVWLARHDCYRACLLIELIWFAYRASAIYLLDGWRESGGACVERSLAFALGKRVCYENFKKKKR